MIFCYRACNLFFSQCSSFWQKHLALLYGLSLLLGNLAALSWDYSLLFFFSCFLLTFYNPLKKKQFFFNLLLAVLLSIFSFFYVRTTVQFPRNLDKGMEGIAHFRIHSIHEVQKSHYQGWVYKGIVKKYVSKKGTLIARNIPCHIAIKKEWDRPVANADYFIQGKLQGSNKWYSLKIDGTPWKKIKGSFNLAEKQFLAKSSLKNYLKENFTSSRAAIFLTGISTGMFNDTLMIHEFGKLGLQHIMAISGFHFSLIAAFFCLFLRVLFSPKITAAILLVLLSFYFLFIGLSPSIERAYIVFTIFLMGQICEKKSVSLNSLGIALIIILICHPLYSMNLGFQFSFLATAAILLCMQTMEHFLEKIFKPRLLKEVIKMRMFDQHGYLLLTLSKQSLALTLSVHLATLPLILYAFHKFPVLSLIYNLFFPLLVTLSLFLLLSGLFFSFLPWVSKCIHLINSYYTESILTLTENPSHAFAYTFYIEEIPLQYIVIFYSFLFISALFFYNKEKDPWWLV